MRETDDFSLDIEFGKWLSEIRKKANLTVREVARQTGISEGRLMGLEMGYSERGVTAKELKALSAVYSVSEEELTSKALG